MRFFLIDKIVEYDRLSSATAIKNVTLSEDYLADHFPGFPVYPGCLLIESMAQLGGFLIECGINTDPNDVKRAMLVQVDRAKFHQPATPGDQLNVHCRIDSIFEGAAQLSCEVTRESGGNNKNLPDLQSQEKVASAVLTFAMRNVNIPEIHEQRRAFYRLVTNQLQADIVIL